MNACSHVAAYWALVAGRYRRLHWYGHWTRALRISREYANRSIGIEEDDLDECEEEREENDYVAEGGQFGMGA